MPVPSPMKGASLVLFTSRRERQLWAALFAVLVAIYSTLGVARSVVDVLRAHGLVSWCTTAALLAMASIIGARWLRGERGGREIGVMLGVGFAYFMVLARLDRPEERTHLMEYGVVAALIHMALLERQTQGRWTWHPALVAVVGTALLGFVDECIQWKLPGRYFDLRDVGFNALAGVMVVLARVSLGAARPTDSGDSL